MTSNPDCVFHAKDDTLVVQTWLDNEAGSIWGHTLHVSNKLVFKHGLTQFKDCDIYFTQQLLDNGPWYSSLVHNEVPRFINCDVTFGSDQWHFNGIGAPIFIKKLND